MVGLNDFFSLSPKPGTGLPGISREESGWNPGGSREVGGWNPGGTREVGGWNPGGAREVGGGRWMGRGMLPGIRGELVGRRDEGMVVLGPGSIILEILPPGPGGRGGRRLGGLGERRLGGPGERRLGGPPRLR